MKCNFERINRITARSIPSCTARLLSTNLPALLHYEDRNSMAFSLESRVPSLDVRLVEYIASLPLSQKIRGGVTKIALRSAIRGRIPESVRCRGDKMGFVTPEECWMRADSGHLCSRSSHPAVSDPGLTGMRVQLHGITRHSLMVHPPIRRALANCLRRLWLRKFIDAPVS